MRVERLSGAPDEVVARIRALVPGGASVRRDVEAIVDAAKISGCDLVVMASHGLRGVSEILDSETLKVLTHSAVPILVYR